MAAYAKLDAVNRMLSAIGESPVSSLDSGVQEAENAENILDEITREVLAPGWLCNTDDEIELTVNGDDEFEVPEDALSIDTSGSDSWIDVTIRNGVLWDRKNYTSTFTNTDTLICRIVRLLDFEDLPYTLANYIAARAAAIFQKREEGSQVSAGFNSEEEQHAWAIMQDDESVTDDANPLYDSPSVNAIVYRNNRLYGAR